MPLQVQYPLTITWIIDKVIRYYRGVPWDGGTNIRRIDTIDDDQSEISNAQSGPRKKRRKKQASLCLKVEYVDTMISWVRDDNVITIGIHGMGGVGKMTLATELFNRVLQHDMPAAFVSVGVDFTVYQLQEKISGAFGLDLEGDKDEIRRAGRINAFLLRINKCVLFLDDLWGDFRREEVGIPWTCKLVLVSRSFDVCRVLRCEKILKVEPLSEEESWELFQHSIGCGVLNNEEVPRIRKLVYEKCGGLALAIVELANSSTKVVADNASSLREVLESTDHLEDTFSQLKKSYDRLNNVKIQRCFLYCASYPKGYAISREKLIRFWVKEKIIDDVESLQAQYDMGHSILNKLLNFCLLQTCQDERSVKMHDLIRNMALSVAKDNFMVKAGVRSKF